MKSVMRYEIFQKVPDSDIKWLEFRTSLKEAKNRLKQLEVLCPGFYFILDIQNARFIVPHHSSSANSPSKADFGKTVRNRTDGMSAGRSKDYAPPSVRRIQIPR